MSLWHLWDAPCVPAELGTGDLSACGCLCSAALCIVAQPGPAQAFSGFPANLDGHKTKVLV